MKRRCYDVRAASYERYGAVGITVCRRWLKSFANFLADMGERPEGMTLDRKNPSKNYSPGNCRWATKEEQARNRRGVTSAQNRAAIVRAYAAGYRMKRLAELFNVERHTIRRVLRSEGVELPGQGKWKR